MRFSVVTTGYDQRQVDSCLDQIGVRLARIAARAEGAARAGREWDLIREEATALRGVLQRLDSGGPGQIGRGAGDAERAAADLLAQARFELDAAREEARQVRERVYAEAVQARRDFEEALHARRRREARVDHFLDGLTVEPVPADTPTAAAGVPGTRIAARGGADASSEPPGGRAGIR
ncbi:ATPase [Micromonospora sp. NPDC047074]|uniref:ATPase n=1 Tax=Micromonospora sp. NPDC047074 TaxID=3154339 RepID=UPI003409E8F1